MVGIDPLSLGCLYLHSSFNNRNNYHMSTSIPFVKYHGTGNDFVIIDQRAVAYIAYDQVALIARMCRRHFGIGADGLMILAASDEADFEMVYFNADGGRSTMCGNGGRCIVHFARELGIIDAQTSFIAIDKLYEARIEGDAISLRMPDVDSISRDGDAYVIDTGSPHYVKLADEAAHADIVDYGASVRYNDRYKADGINVNLLTARSGDILVTTYERGVEDMTLSCGTGVTAAAIVAHKNGAVSPVAVSTPGGRLEVSFSEKGGDYHDVWLTGPAQRVYSGVWLG